MVSYRPHNDFEMFSENVLYNRSEPLELFTTHGYDRVFLTPGTERSRAFYELTLAANTTTVPFVWSPRLIDKVRPTLKRPTYIRRPGKNAVVVLQSNQNLGRNMVIPTTMIELVYR